MQLRAVDLGDAEAIRAIYNREVTESTVTFDLVPRDPEAQRAWITDHLGAYPAIVAVGDSGDVAGFASLSAYRDRPAYKTTAEDSVYVHSDHRGEGIGRRLLEEILSQAELRGFHSVIARIMGEHTVSIALHESCGFAMVGVEREVGRKFGRWLDVAVMQKML